MRNRHLGFFLDLARRAEPELMGLRQASWLKELHLEHDNLRAALDWCMAPDQLAEQPDRALDSSTALWWFWVKRGFLTEGRQWLDRAVAMAPESSPSRRARACAALANMTYFKGDFSDTATYAMNSVALGREAGDLFSVAFGLGLQTIAAAEVGDVGWPSRSPANVGRLRSRAETRGPRARLSTCWDFWPSARVTTTKRAASTRRRGSSASAIRGLRAFMCRVWSGFGSFRGVMPRPTRWRPKASRCVGIEDPIRTAWSLVGVGAAQAVQGRPLDAARLWGASDQLLDSAAASLPPTHRWIRDRHVEAVRAALGDAAFRAASAEGRAMSMRQAIQCALEASQS